MCEQGGRAALRGLHGATDAGRRSTGRASLMREAVAVDADTNEPSLLEQERALTETVGAVLRTVDVVEVTGEQAVKFLDGQLSQDIAALPPGNSAWSFVLQPQGKVVALVRVSVISADRVLLDTDAGLG